MSVSYKLDQTGELPKEAPRAPTQAEWDRLDAAQREQVMEALVCSESQEELDEADAMAEGDEHYDVKEEVRKTLKTYFGPRGQVYVGAERKVLYPGQKGFTPDIIAVVGVSPHKRDCWMVSHEGRGVDVIIEVHYKGDWRKDFVNNVTRYAQLGVPEYFIFNARHGALTAYHLPEGGAEYVPMRRRAGRYHSAKLGLDVAVRRGKLRFFHETARLPTPDELIAELEDIAEQEQARAEQEQARAEQAGRRLAEGVLSVARLRGLPLTEEDAARIRAEDDVEVLSRWMDRVTSMTAEECAAGRLFLDG
jgi:Uma2 family endonuclease